MQNLKWRFSETAHSYGNACWVASSLTYHAVMYPALQAMCAGIVRDCSLDICSLQETVK